MTGTHCLAQMGKRTLREKDLLIDDTRGDGDGVTGRLRLSSRLFKHERHENQKAKRKHSNLQHGIAENPLLNIDNAIKGWEISKSGKTNGLM